MNPSAIQQSINEFEELLIRLPEQLAAMPDTILSASPAPGKWSKKQIIGHLIDSAANNHQRFIRAQYEPTPTLVYDQNNWNQLNHYHDADPAVLIRLLCAYNQHLLHVIRHMSDENLLKTCDSGNAAPATLAFLFNDYVAHFKHHLNQIFS